MLLKIKISYELISMDSLIDFLINLFMSFFESKRPDEKLSSKILRTSSGVLLFLIAIAIIIIVLILLNGNS